MSAPAASGPKTIPNDPTVAVSAVAGAMSSLGTSRATAAVRVGMLTATNACWTAKSPSTPQTLVPTTANSQKSALVAATPTLVTRMTVRRSNASASAPPQSPKISNGTSPNAPASPTNPDDPVMSNTCLGTATVVSCDPTAVIAVESQSRR